MPNGLTPVDLSIGERIALWRNRNGLTQEEAAGLAGVSVSLWRKWETGARAVARFSQLVNIAQALGVDDLRHLTGQPYALSPGGEPHHEAVGPLRTALARHPALAGRELPPNLGQLTERVNRAWAAAQAASPWRYAETGAVLPDLLLDAEAAIRAFTDERMHARAVRTAGAAYLLARAWAKWVGEHDLALVCGERSLTVAQRGSDPGLLGAAAWNMAQALSTRGDAEPAAAVVDDALGILAAEVATDTAPPDLVSSWGALHLIGMVAAVRSDDRPRARRMLRTAAQAAARLGGDRNDWWMAFGPTNVAIHRVSHAVELGHSRTAVRGATGLRVTLAPSVERRVSHRLDLAQSHTRLREDDPALAALLAAEAESPEQVQYSPVARASIREMLRRETPRTRPTLRPLAARLGVLD
ncbi:MAG: XRE family transcriptional regulator [Pseudonocardiales bacterium]|nr:MAG: XRE family transcriptional regulator [Pseudonocardiales bacterium]